MVTKRKVCILGLQRIPINGKAFIKIIRYYYRGPHHITVHFDNRLNCWASHEYVAQFKTHHIHISPKWCRFNLVDEVRNFETLNVHALLQKVNDKDLIARIIQTTLHELKHAMQCDNNPIRWAKCDDSEHPSLENTSMSYEFSLLESEAEGWSLTHVNRALDRYESWCNN